MAPRANWTREAFLTNSRLWRKYVHRSDNHTGTITEDDAPAILAERHPLLPAKTVNNMRDHHTQARNPKAKKPAALNDLYPDRPFQGQQARPLNVAELAEHQAEDAAIEATQAYQTAKANFNSAANASNNAGSGVASTGGGANSGGDGGTKKRKSAARNTQAGLKKRKTAAPTKPAVGPSSSKKISRSQLGPEALNEEGGEEDEEEGGEEWEELEEEVTFSDASGEAQDDDRSEHEDYGDQEFGEEENGQPALEGDEPSASRPVAIAAGRPDRSANQSAVAPAADQGAQGAGEHDASEQGPTEDDEQRDDETFDEYRMRMVQASEVGEILNDRYTKAEYKTKRMWYLGRHPSFKHGSIMPKVNRDVDEVFASGAEKLSVQAVRRLELEQEIDPLTPLPTKENLQTLDNDFTSYPDREWTSEMDGD